MSIRITIACPETLIDEANQFALCLGYSPADAQTFRVAMWEDAHGARFALASLLASDQFPHIASSALSAPTHTPDADTALATRAQAALADMDTSYAGTVPSTNVAKIGSRSWFRRWVGNSDAWTDTNPD